MRIPVFARRSNPSIDPPIQRKSLSYCEKQVIDWLANWVDPTDKRKGIIAREYLAFGERTQRTPEDNPTDSRLPRVELPGLFFRPPVTMPGPSVAGIREGWDWAGA